MGDLEYDERNNCIKHFCYGPDGEFQQGFGWKFDESDNLISEDEYDADGNIINTYNY